MEFSVTVVLAIKVGSGIVVVLAEFRFIAVLAMMNIIDLTIKNQFL